MEGFGKVHVVPAPPFSLLNQDKSLVTLADLLATGPALLAFYPGDFTPSCTKQLCNYRDNMEEFQKFPVRVCGISSDPPESHKNFFSEHGFPFPLLSDPGQKTAKAYGCTSMMLFGGVSRAIFIINKQGMILYRYVEPTTLTSRKAEELVLILKDLRSNALI